MSRDPRWWLSLLIIVLILAIISLFAYRATLGH
jgi:hypothetical protein